MLKRCLFCVTALKSGKCLSANLAISSYVNTVRFGSNFINSKTAAQLWQGVTPHDQKKHHGGKRLVKKAVKDLNIGRPIGTGKLGILWPGLNAPLKIQHYNTTFKDAFDAGSVEVALPSSHGLTKEWMQPKGVLGKSILNKPPQPSNRSSSSEKINKMSKRKMSTSAFQSGGGRGEGGRGGQRSRFNTVRIDESIVSLKDLKKTQIERFDEADKNIRKRSYNAPLSIRGWTSKSLGGLSVGGPDVDESVDYNGFQTKILETKRVCVMKGGYGRKYSKWVLVVTGNYDGLIGFGFAKAEQVKQAVKLAKNYASKRLIHVERNDSTIFTDSTVDIERTTVHLRRMHRGGGLKCSRVIREILQLAGFTDVYAKIEGPTNTLKVVRATFEILSNQKSYQQLADEKKLNVVLFRDDFPHYPIVLASPSDGVTLPGRNLAPEGELNEEELNQTVYDLDYRHEKKEKIKRYYGIDLKPHPFARPGFLVPTSLQDTVSKRMQ